MPAKPSIITNPLTHRGTAFTHEQRMNYGLIGRFPAGVETLDEQASRALAGNSAFSKWCAK